LNQPSAVLMGESAIMLSSYWFKSNF